MFGQFRVIHARNLDRFCHLVAVGAVHNLQPVVQEVIGAHKLAPNADGPAGRGDINRQILLNLVDDLKHIAAFAVHLVAKGQDRQVTQPADLKQLLRLAFHALGPVNHHDRGVDGGEGAIGVLGEIRVTGGVDQIEAELAVVKGHGRGGYGNAPIRFDLHEVGPRAPRFALGAHLACHLNGAPEQQELFGQSGFARVGVRDDRKCPAAGDFGRKGRCVCHGAGL